MVSDIYTGALETAREMGATVVEPDGIYDVTCDIFSPCALGGTLNDRTIPRLRCSVVAGGANNQLLTDEDGAELHRRGILYAPDYIINAGGIINVSCELGSGYSVERATEMTERIYETMERTLHVSSRDEIPTAQAADRMAEERISSVRQLRGIYRSH